MDKLIRAIKKFGKVIEALTELALKAGTLVAAIYLLLQIL